MEKAVIITARFVPDNLLTAEQRQRRLVNLHLVVGVYQLKDAPSGLRESSKFLEDSATIFGSRTQTCRSTDDLNATELDMISQLREGYLMASTSIDDDRAPVEITSELVKILGGVEGMVSNTAVDSDKRKRAQAYFPLYSFKPLKAYLSAF